MEEYGPTTTHQLDIRERLRAFGIDGISDDEVLALVLRTGRPGENARALARRILDGVSHIAALAKIDVHELEGIAGIGRARAATIVAAIELGHRVHRPRLGLETPLQGPVDAATHVRSIVAGSMQEEFHVLMLDAKHCVVGHRRVTIGTLQASLVHPREVFRPAIRCGAAAILVVHNHPSGDPTPSDEDRAVTQRLEEVGVWVGIPVLDHLVLGALSFYSFAEGRLFTWP